ncbi:MAG: FHA domain-containing protein [Planctomycetaceae bacterium]|nr:FHA domain-containing protein [Planctomycetaceae bacterium]
MAPTFVLVVYGNHLKKQIVLSETQYMIGRDSGCSVCLADTEVSRRHAVLTLEQDGRVILEDLNSLNGTFVNGKQIKRDELQPGDRIQMGGTLLLLVKERNSEFPASSAWSEGQDHPLLSEERELRVREFQAREFQTREFQTREFQTREFQTREFQTREFQAMGAGAQTLYEMERFSGEEAAFDAMDVTMISAGESERILKTISHTEGEKFLAHGSGNRLGIPETWVSKAQGFLDLLYKMTHSVRRYMDIDELTANLLDLIFKSVDADRGCILLFDSSTNCLVPRAKKVRGQDPQQKMIISKTILDYVLKNGKGVLTSNAQNDERWNDANSVLTVGIHEAICVPLQGRYGNLGAIYLDTFCSSGGVGVQENHRFSEEYLKLMITIAHYTALAVEDTRYYQGMLQSERLAAIGQTVATLSHHIKNILQGIQGGSFLIRNGLEQHQEAFIAKGWKIVERNQNRISALIMDMLTFSKDRKPELVQGNLNQVAGEVVEFMQERAGKANVLLTWDPDENVPDSLFDPEAIYHAVLNLVTNAIDAVVEVMLREQEEREKQEMKAWDSMETIPYSENEAGTDSENETDGADRTDDETVSLEPESVFADGSHIFSGLGEEDWELAGMLAAGDSGTSLPYGQIDVVTQYDPAKNVIRIYVKDTGPGLTREQIATIFRPFESSKGNRGTGLGLPVCRKIAREHGGTIHVEQRMPRGCRFVLTLPVIQDS